MTHQDLNSAAAGLLAQASAKQALLAYPFEQSVEPTDDVEAHCRAFQARVDDAVQRLTAQYGPIVDQSAARKAGIDPHVFLSHPPTSDTESDVMTCAAWRTGVRWLFLAARHYSKGAICWSLILLGAAVHGGTPADELAMRHLA
jgi:hypothetical protein